VNLIFKCNKLISRLSLFCIVFKKSPRLRAGILTRIEQLDKPALLKFADIVNGLISKKSQVGQREAQLLKKIKTHIPTTMKRRQKELYAKMQDNTLSLPERDELILLNTMIEEKTAEKIVKMLEN
jgi:hypothetical protein